MLGHDEGRDDMAGLVSALSTGGYSVAAAPLDGRSADVEDRLTGSFGGRPPDILLADVSRACDSLPLQHAHRALRAVWGEDAPMPLVVALLHERLLPQSDWRAYVDDFLMPPYRPDEVVARVSLLLFRRRHVLADNAVTLPGITIHLDAALVVDEHRRPISLTPREFDLLTFLATHRGRFFPRHRLLDLVWGIDFDGGERTVDIHVRRLRAKLPTLTASLLRTRRGNGYGI